MDIRQGEWRSNRTRDSKCYCLAALRDSLKSIALNMT